MTQITIPNVDTEVEYSVVASSTGPFSVPFPFFDEYDVRAIVTDASGIVTNLSNNSGFVFDSKAVPLNQEGSGYLSGTIVLDSAIGSDGATTLKVFRSTVIDRTANYSNTGPFNISLLNDEQNKHIAIMQEIGTDVESNGTLSDLNAVNIAANTLAISNMIATPGVTPNYPVTDEETAASISPSNFAYPPGNVRRYGADPTGVSDSTDAFAEILEAGGFDVYLPTGTYEVDPSAWDATDHILVGSNTRIYCEPGVTVRIPTGGGTADRGFIRMRDVSNVTIIGNFSIWEYETKPTANESRHIFGIRGSTNIYIENTIANKAGGDGYYIGEGVGDSAVCTNVTLVNVQADNCRRQGLSIIGGTNIRVYGARFTNITGTAPEYGVDIEPNNNTHELTDIELHDVYTKNCTTGIGIALQNHAGATDQSVSIRIINPVDVGSNIAYSVRGGEVGAGNYSGRIIFENLISEDAVNGGARIVNWPSDGPSVEFLNPTVARPNTIGSTSDQFGAAFYMDDDDSIDLLGFQGNVLIENPTIIDEDANITNYFFIKATKTGTDNSGLTAQSVLTDTTASWAVNEFVGAKLTNVTGGGDSIITANTATTITNGLTNWDDGDTYVISQLIKDVRIIGDFNLSGQATPADAITFDGSGVVEDKNRSVVRDQTASPLTFGGSAYTRYITNSGASATVEIDLEDLPPGFPEITFEVQAAQILRVDPDAGSQIYPGSNGAGFYIQSNNIGDRLTIRRQSRTEWFITEEIGTWTRQT